MRPWFKNALGAGLTTTALLLLSAVGSLAAARPQIDLTGEWDFYPDVGEAKIGGVQREPGKIIVPGAWQAQGYGAPGGSIPSANIGPGTSPAEYLRHNLMGRCLYARNTEVPAQWQGQRIFLCVRRAYRYTDLAVNGRDLGTYEGFCSPFEFEITEAVKFGAANQIILGVDNRPRPGRDTLGTANLFGNWGGLGGRVYLEARPRVWIQDVFAMPRLAATQVVFRVTLQGSGSSAADLAVQARIAPYRPGGNADTVARGQAALPASGSNQVDVTVTTHDARLWTPNDPFLYVARVQLRLGDRVLDELETRFGLREITAEGNNLFLNGKPLYLSGYGDDATEPITGMLPADKAIYLKRLNLMRSLGFNFVRHHSCVPHDEYLEAADEVGMLVQPEAGLAYTGFWRTGHQMFGQEWPNIVRAFRNHPCVWAWCMGNELFLGELPERATNGLSLNLSQPLSNGPLQAVSVVENGVFGPPAQFPTNSFKQSNYYRDLEVLLAGEPLNLMGNAASARIFNDGPHELGLKFLCQRPGQVIRIRFLKVPEETGAHVGRLWNSSGEELVHALFTNETASGWQEVTLPSPLSIVPNQIYVVSVNANTAYAASSGEAAGFSRQDALDLVAQAYRQAKELDPTRLVHASDGGHPQPFSDIYSHGGAEKFGPKPFLLHEYGTYTCSLPDFSLIPRLKGVIRPLTYERAERYVRDRHLEAVYPRLYTSSLQMRADAQKHYIEAARAARGNNGFSFWLGIDFPDSPEGCWDEGILNQLWEPKPYLTNGLPEIAGHTVLLCDAGLGSRSFCSGETKKVGLRLWHYGAEPIKDARFAWRVKHGERVLQSSESAGTACGCGERVSLGEIAIESLPSDLPRFLRLEVELRQGTRPLTRNAWEFYAYPRVARPAALTGVYSEAGPLPGATALSTNSTWPEGLRVLITRELRRSRHAALLRKGNCAVLLLGTGGFKETRAGYFLNQYGSGFGGIIGDHPVFATIPHEGRLHLGLHQLIAGGGLLEAELMPAPLRDGAVVWGLKLTGWISPVKELNKALHWSEVITENQLHLVLCNLDLRSDKPESRYVLARTLDYLAAGRPCPLAKPCKTSELDPFLR